MTINSSPRIYRYVVRYDGGTAPNPYGGYCTLALCKACIRRMARVNDWILGFRSKQPGRVVYVMQVSEALSFADYWSDRRFRSRKPGDGSVPTDNIYQPVSTEGTGKIVLRQVDNATHGEGNVTDDLSGERVLISERFWYFGDRSPLIDDRLRHLMPYRRNYSVHVNRRTTDIEQLEKWLAKQPQGKHGTPINKSMSRAAKEPGAKCICG